MKNLTLDPKSVADPAPLRTEMHETLAAIIVKEN
jgi:hypothetical protein